MSCLDDVDIVSVDMDLRPFDWDVNGKQGRTAYLQSICVTQQIDRFAAKYGLNDNDSDDYCDDEEDAPF